MDETPSPSKKWKIQKPFYGWVIVGVAFLIGFTEAGVFQNILSVFLKPMAAEFGWNRSIITGAIAFGSVCGGIAGPFVGPILDRHGPRMVAFWGVLVLSAGLVTLSLLSSVWQLYIFFGVGRMIAVGILSLVIAVTVSNWFIEHRGRAMGIAQLGSRVGTAIFPPFVQYMIVAIGWRLAWAVLGVAVFLLSAVPSLLFMKRRPEDVGLWPDGKTPVSGDETHADSAGGYGPDGHNLFHEDEWTREQVLRTPAFWLLNLLNCFILFSGAGINFHLFPFMTDRGIPPGSAVLILSVIAISSAVGGLILGYTAEKIRPQYLLAVVVVVLSVLFLSLFWAVTSWFIIVFGVFFGMLRGGMMPLIPLIWADFYGRASMGTVFSLSSPLRLTANALGPIFGAVCFDFLGGYTVPFSVFAALFLLAGLTGFIIKSPGHPSARA